MKRLLPLRLFILLVAPPLLVGLVAPGLLLSVQNARLESARERYGLATARQLADQLAPHLVEQDIISLNVIATRLTSDAPVSLIAIYDGQDRLVTQSGRETPGASSFSAEITFQDSVIGITRVAVDRESSSPAPLIIGLLPALVWAVLVWRCLPFINAWLAGRPEGPAEAAPGPGSAHAGAPQEECVLVVRIRPARRLAQHRHSFRKAAGLYGGMVEQTTPEELVIHFAAADAAFLATCTGLLLRQVAGKVSGALSFGGALAAPGDAPDRMRKEISYLASIADGDLLLAGAEPSILGRARLQAFRHALVDSGNLLKIAGISNQELIDAQADQLLGKDQGNGGAAE